MALTPTSVTSAGTTVTAAAFPSTSENIPASVIGVNGALLRIINNSGGTITATITDPGATPAGNAGTPTGVSIGNGLDKWFRLTPVHVALATQVANVQVSSNSSVTYILIPC